MKKNIVMACLLAAMQTGAWAKVVLPDQHGASTTN